MRTGALAETRIGAARGMSDVVYLSIGTGIAAGIVLGGRLHAGDGYAGEIGHTPAGHDEPCACGGSGCLEAIASAAAIARRYTARSGRPAAGAAEVLAAGDPDALAVWDEALDALAAALAWIASVLAPEAVVIGGGLSRAGAALFDPLNDRLARHLTFQRVPRLVPAALGDRAGCIGAGPAGARFHPSRLVASGGWSRRPSSTSPATRPRGARPRRASGPATSC